jgi:hypothetical protein
MSNGGGIETASNFDEGNKGRRQSGVRGSTTELGCIQKYVQRWREVDSREHNSTKDETRRGGQEKGT